jgi:hypothetical protein
MPDAPISMPMASHHERRITIPAPLWDSLGYYVADERLKVSEEVKGLITNESMTLQILENHLKKMGHYPPKVVMSDGWHCRRDCPERRIMKLLETLFGERKMESDDETPEIKQNKKYRLCTENNPDERHYRCNKKDVMSPACKLSLSLDGLTVGQLDAIEMEILKMLERNGFQLR